MAQITPNDPARRNKHDYVLTDPTTGNAIATFATQEEALNYSVTTLVGKLSVLEVSHPWRCNCFPEETPKVPA